MLLIISAILTSILGRALLAVINLLNTEAFTFNRWLFAHDRERVSAATVAFQFLSFLLLRRCTSSGIIRIGRSRQVHHGAVADGRVPASQPSVKIHPDDSVAPVLSGAQVEELAMRRCIDRHKRNSNCNVSRNWSYPADKLEEAYQTCAKITEHYAKTFYLGTQLMTPEKARATWAIYVWCRRTDELVDGPNADRITPQVLFISGGVWVLLADRRLCGPCRI